MKERKGEIQKEVKGSKNNRRVNRKRVEGNERLGQENFKER